jgi:hypothetical protein
MRNLKKLSLSMIMRADQDDLSNWIEVIQANPQLTHLVVWFAYDDAEDYSEFVNQVRSTMHHALFPTLLQYIGNLKHLESVNFISIQLSEEQINIVTAHKRPGFDLAFFYGHLEMQNPDLPFPAYTIEDLTCL